MYSSAHVQLDLPLMGELEMCHRIPFQSHQDGMYQCHLTSQSDQFQFTIDHNDRIKSQRDHINKTSVCQD